MQLHFKNKPIWTIQHGPVFISPIIFRELYSVELIHEHLQKNRYQQQIRNVFRREALYLTLNDGVPLALNTARILRTNNVNLIGPCVAFFVGQKKCGLLTLTYRHHVEYLESGSVLFIPAEGTEVEITKTHTQDDTFAILYFCVR